MDIIETLFKNKITVHKLCFKVDIQDLQKHLSFEKEDKIIVPKKYQNDKLTPFYDENVMKVQNDNEYTCKYYEIEMKYAMSETSNSGNI